MDQLFTFISNHPFLVGAFVVLLALFIRNEMNRGGTTLGAQQVVNLVNNEGAVVLDTSPTRQAANEMTRATSSIR